jgi:polyhydroxyalkanoate synthesis regulator protein
MSMASEPTPILVKRYGGNRLYDTVRACYVSADQLHEWMRQGIRFSVIDAGTGSDITRKILR